VGPQQALGEVIQRFEERSSWARGRRVRVEENGGYEGVTEGLEARGFLRVRTESGMRTVLSGGVRALE
jgi:BirA family biotin operon repressor/biotin-[acetyl-CoA-carboxylase] ligase